MPHFELLKTLLEESICKFYKNDICLLERKGGMVRMERCVVMRIYYYMQRMLDDDPRFSELKHYNLDGEYNRNGTDPKRIRQNSKNGDIPDVILHRRLSNADNLLIVEFKVRNSTEPRNQNFENDIDKLICATSKDGEFRFFLGVSVVLTPKDKNLRYFQCGKETTLAELKCKV
ncbi:MAG: hypothetical protein LBU65_15345 [Planctomycetaceae bacterium]|jgi:hypothetical protein|nr:hypothetical protein [Planctomycetaceae bacterium]